MKKWNPAVVVAVVIYLALTLFLAGFAHAASEQITFAWEQDITADFGGWKIYSAASPGGPYTQVGADIPFTQAQTTYTQQSEITVPADAETTLYFVVRAFDKKGNLSGPSNEVSHAFDFLGPPAPKNMNITLVLTVRSQ